MGTRVDHTKPNTSAKPSIQWKGAAAEFVQWTKDHPASWDLSVMLMDGKITNFMDPDTDNAWMGFQAGWRAHRKITEDALKGQPE